MELHGGWGCVLIHGACRGTDEIAAEEMKGVYARGELPGELVLDPHPAEWTRFGRRAGPIRNGEMVALKPDVCLAFPMRGSGGKGGTWDCIHQAADAGIPVRIYSLDPVA